MTCPNCKCETHMTVCPSCGGNTNHMRAQAAGYRTIDDKCDALDIGKRVPGPMGSIGGKPRGAGAVATCCPKCKHAFELPEMSRMMARYDRCMDILREIALHDRMETSNETLAQIDALLKDYP